MQKVNDFESLEKLKKNIISMIFDLIIMFYEFYQLIAFLTVLFKMSYKPDYLRNNNPLQNYYTNSTIDPSKSAQIKK